MSKEMFKHSVEKDWWKNLPHPKEWRQSNCISCPACHLILCYSYHGKQYGMDRDKAVYDEIPKCRISHNQKGVRKIQMTYEGRPVNMDMIDSVLSCFNQDMPVHFVRELINAREDKK